jgi:uncharacterized protein YdaU (DUF1376 family)
MTTPPWMPLYIADYLADTGHLSTEEHGAYLLLTMHYWRTGGLPDDDGELALISRLPEKRWQQVRLKLARLFKDGWRHTRVDAELARAHAKHERRAEAGKRGGIAKSDAKQNPSNASRLLEHPPDNALASSSQPESEDKANALSSARGAPPENVWPKDFREQFWAAYPRKVGKAAAIKALETIRKRGAVPFDRVLAGLRAFVATNPDPQFTPHPLTWLHQGRWDDELAGGNVVRLDLGGKFWAALDSPQWQAWTEYRGGRAPPLDRNGGWLFDAEWPPQLNEAAE